MRQVWILLIALGAGANLGAATEAPGDAPAAAGATAAAPVPAPVPAPAPSAAEFAGAERSHFDLSRPEIHSYIDQLVAQGFDREGGTALLGAPGLQPKIIAAISRPVEKTLQWWEYRARVLTPARIDAGVQLWHEH